MTMSSANSIALFRSSNRRTRRFAATDATFGGHTHLRDPVSRRVVHAAGGHDAEYPLGERGMENPLTRDRLDATASQRRRHQTQVPAVDLDRALPEVDVEGELRILLENAEAAQHVADRSVAVSRAVLGGEHGIVQRQLPPGEP